MYFYLWPEFYWMESSYNKEDCIMALTAAILFMTRRFQKPLKKQCKAAYSC
jgi:hypothetical protein